MSVVQLCYSLQHPNYSSCATNSVNIKKKRQKQCMGTGNQFNSKYNFEIFFLIFTSNGSLGLQCF